MANRAMFKDKKIKPKVCKQCKLKFTPTKPLQHVCGFECAVDYALALKIKNEAVKQRKERAERKQRLKSIKSISELANEAQEYVNRYVRLRDAKYGCISCDKTSRWRGQWHAGHYKSRGANSALRFHLWNIHKQCSVCNNHLSGNIGQYRIGLENRIGKEKLDFIENHAKYRKYDREYLIRLKRVFMRMCRKIVK